MGQRNRRVWAREWFWAVIPGTERSSCQLKQHLQNNTGPNHMLSWVFSDSYTETWSEQVLNVSALGQHCKQHKRVAAAQENTLFFRHRFWLTATCTLELPFHVNYWKKPPKFMEMRPQVQSQARKQMRAAEQPCCSSGTGEHGRRMGGAHRCSQWGPLRLIKAN